jgi:hypothetical protein
MLLARFVTLMCVAKLSYLYPEHLIAQKINLPNNKSVGKPTK